MCLFFFFQAEDGIRDYKVTGVQTCALPISRAGRGDGAQSQEHHREDPAGHVHLRDRRLGLWEKQDRKSTRLNSSHLVISYAVFCLKKKKSFPLVQIKLTIVPTSSFEARTVA